MTGETTAICEGCGRTLRAPESVEAKRGPVCRAKKRGDRVSGNYARDAARRHQRGLEAAAAAHLERMEKLAEEERERLQALTATPGDDVPDVPDVPAAPNAGAAS